MFISVGDNKDDLFSCFATVAAYSLRAARVYGMKFNFFFLPKVFLIRTARS